MPFAFLRALNPLSEFSGVYLPNNEQEIRDRMVSATIAHLLQRNHNLFCMFDHIDEIVIGNHYFPRPRNRGCGSKGLLDFLIFPLLARKLLFDVMCNEGSRRYRQLFALPVGFCLELLRFTMGIILLSCLTPLIITTYMIYAFFFIPSNNPNTTQQRSSPRPSANEEKISHLNLDHPPEFICPISFQLMTHPVRVIHHHQQRFERDWIKCHFQKNGYINPLTREPLSDAELVDDLDLKENIDSYVQNLLSAKNNLS